MAALVGSGLVSVGLVVGPAPEAEAKVVELKLRGAVKRLPVAGERRAGYDRDEFTHWVDANRDCQDTRAEVLVLESEKRARGGCTIHRGKWRSYYDRRTHRDAGKLDVDHLVPLAEAWDSGARGWSSTTRRRFANDLGDGRALVAVTSGVNRSKSDRDPAEWLPRYGKCRYVRDWVAVKLRWSLRVDRAEKRTLRRIASGCRNVRVRVDEARVRRRGGGNHDSGPRAWYPPVSTYRCPPRAPIKGNQSSMIYHPPSSPWYSRTTPEKCFATERAARRAGFRRARY